MHWFAADYFCRQNITSFRYIKYIRYLNHLLHYTIPQEKVNTKAMILTVALILWVRHLTYNSIYFFALLQNVWTEMEGEKE